MTVHDMPVSSLRRLVSLATGLGLLAWTIAGCGLIPRHVPRASDQWSNGALLGTAILNNQVAFFLAFPSATGGQQAELAVAFNARVYARNSDALQIVVLTFREGRLVDYQIVNDSQAASLQPNVATDADHNLHLVWIDTAGFNRYQVVYASTSQQVKATLNQITMYDVVNKVLSMAMSAVSALFFIPLVLGWMLVPMGWLLISTLSTSASEVSDRRGQIALGVAMLLHVGGKQLFFPSLLARFSFAPLLPSSAGLFLGRWILPLLLAALSAVVMWAYLKRARSPSILIAYLIYAAVDALLTLVIYVGLATE
jgi:hypothetical protein